MTTLRKFVDRVVYEPNFFIIIYSREKYTIFSRVYESRKRNL